MTPEVHIVLLHYPVLNKLGHLVSTAVTNLDIHDNARSARTFNVASYHVVTPLDAQIDLVSRMVNHWNAGFGARRVPNRVEAINLVKVDRTLADAIDGIKGGRDVEPFTIATSARYVDKAIGFAQMRDRMHSQPGPYVLLFGTGYGLADAVIESSDAVLESIGNSNDWNHLSVRSAVAIILDRLLGKR